MQIDFFKEIETKHCFFGFLHNFFPWIRTLSFLPPVLHWRHLSTINYVLTINLQKHKEDTRKKKKTGRGLACPFCHAHLAPKSGEGHYAGTSKRVILPR